MNRAWPATAALTASLIVSGSAALASTGTFNVTSSVTVTTSCTYNGTPTLDFSAYDPIVVNATTPATATGTLSITCPDTLPYSVTANTGLHASSASGACATGTCTRAMNSGTNYLSYDLYTTSGHTTVWNTVNGISGTGTGLAQSVTVYGYIPPAEIAAAGSYSDTVTATVTF